VTVAVDALWPELCKRRRVLVEGGFAAWLEAFGEAAEFLWPRQLNAMRKQTHTHTHTQREREKNLDKQDEHFPILGRGFPGLQPPKPDGVVSVTYNFDNSRPQG
jgi:hypothetical protein